MAYNWFGKEGLVTLISKIKTLTDKYVEKVDGKGLSTNDYTTEEKNKLADLENYELPKASSSELGGIKIGNGLDITEDGTVNVTQLGGVTSVNGKTGAVVLTAGDLDAYTKSEVDGKLTSVYKYKGSVANYASLPKTGLTDGDVYDTQDTGKNYAWAGTKWDDLGGIFDTSGLVAKSDMVEITASDVNEAWNGVFK